MDFYSHLTFPLLKQCQKKPTKLEELDRVRIFLNVQYLFQEPRRSKLNNKSQTIDAKTKMTKTLKLSEKESKTDILEII